MRCYPPERAGAGCRSACASGPKRVCPRVPSQRGALASKVANTRCTTITAPNIEYAKLAQSMGMYGEGPITDPKDLGPALKRALEVVNRGEPAVVDVLTQPR